MSYLSAIGQINSVAVQLGVAAGGAATTVVDDLLTTDALPNGSYLVSFSTRLNGSGVTSGSLYFTFGATVLSRVSIGAAGSYSTLSVPIIVTANQALSLKMVGTGATWDSDAGTLYIVALP